MARPRKVAGTNTPATDAEKPSVTNNELRKVECADLAGQCTIAITGKPIVFDKNGVAMCDAIDAEYLSHIEGFNVE